MIVVGSTWLSRLTPVGQLDQSFGTCGTSPFPQLRIQAAALQLNGDIVIASLNGRLTRLAPNGSVDTSFGSSGSTVLRYGGKPCAIRAIAIEPEGKILVGAGVSRNLIDVTSVDGTVGREPSEPLSVPWAST